MASRKVTSSNESEGGKHMFLLKGRRGISQTKYLVMYERFYEENVPLAGAYLARLL
jgi:hypothetical protein